MTEKEKIEWLKNQIKTCDIMIKDMVEKDSKRNDLDKDSLQKCLNETKYAKQVFESEMRFIHFLDTWSNIEDCIGDTSCK